MFRKKFYYGTGTNHVVKLTQIQADSILNARIADFVETPEGTFVKMGFVGPGNADAYNEAAAILNEYLKTHEVSYTEEDVEAGIPVLRPVS